MSMDAREAADYCDDLMRNLIDSFPVDSPMREKLTADRDRLNATAAETCRVIDVAQARARRRFWRLGA